MANIRSIPDGDAPPVESRRAGLGQVDADQPTAPDEEAPLAPERTDLGEFAAESARPTPLDDIAAAERENLPRD